MRVIVALVCALPTVSLLPVQAERRTYPKAVITAVGDTLFAPTTLRFDARSSRRAAARRSAIVSYTWLINGKKRGVGRQTRISFSRPGKFTVTLTVRDRAGRRSSTRMEIDLSTRGSGAPEPTPTPTPSTGSTPESTPTPNATPTPELSPTPQITPTPALTECNDGIDNDGDGLIDWQYDLGCFNATDGDEAAQSRSQEAGWSTVDPASDTRIIYVSSSVGNDSWSGFCPEAPTSGTCGPKKTIHQGFLLLRTGSADWLLLKRGDLWRNEYFAKFPQYGAVWKGEDLVGRSPTERIVIASYGASSRRPVLEATSVQRLWKVHHVEIRDLEFYSYQKNPARPEFNGLGETGLHLQYDNTYVLVENCHMNYADLAAVSVTDTNGPQLFNHIELRRNVVERAYSLTTHMQGIYTNSGHAAQLLIEENILDHNGWSEEFRLALFEPNENLADWQAVTDGRVGIELNGNSYNVSFLDFTGATSMHDVASLLSDAINSALGAPDTVRLYWSNLGHAFFLVAPTLPSNSRYKFKAYVGGTPGIDLHHETYLNTADQGQPAATVYNRNMYLSQSYGAAVVRGNIDSNGASGGIQLRMGGIVSDNLILKSPLALTFGHFENPPNTSVEGLIERNVILGSRDISQDPRGFGIALGSNATTRSGAGASLLQNVTVSDNIVAHNKLGTGNLFGLGIDGTGPVSNLNVENNIVYNWARDPWPNPADTRACGLRLTVAGGSSEVTISSNTFEQPRKGYAACATSSGQPVTLLNNRYFSSSPDSASNWSSAWFSINSSVSSATWISSQGDLSPTLASANYPDPERSIESYLASLGLPAHYETFTERITEQSRFSWDPAMTAEAVNRYIRVGFGRE